VRSAVYFRMFTCAVLEQIHAQDEDDFLLHCVKSEIKFQTASTLESYVTVVILCIIFIKILRRSALCH